MGSGIGGFSSIERESSIVYVEGGPDAIKAWLADRQLASKAGTGAELAELAGLQLMSGDAVAARATLEHAERILPLATADLLDGSQIRFEYSSALIRAAIELNGGGDRAKAMKILDDFDRLLDTYERSGGTHYGLYVLRAQSLALRGKTHEAQAAIDTAWKQGWRMTWRLRHEPSMAGLTFPK
jgi:hypothetical protein